MYQWVFEVVNFGALEYCTVKLVGFRARAYSFKVNGTPPRILGSHLRHLNQNMLTSTSRLSELQSHNSDYVWFNAGARAQPDQAAAEYSTPASALACVDGAERVRIFSGVFGLIITTGQQSPLLRQPFQGLDDLGNVTHGRKRGEVGMPWRMWAREGASLEERGVQRERER